MKNEFEIGPSTLKPQDKIVFTDLQFPQKSQDELIKGHSRKHRGNHRSETRGKGLEAFFRSLWMERYNK